MMMEKIVKLGRVKKEKATGENSDAREDIYLIDIERLIGDDKNQKTVV